MEIVLAVGVLTLIAATFTGGAIIGFTIGAVIFYRDPSEYLRWTGI